MPHHSNRFTAETGPQPDAWSSVFARSVCLKSGNLPGLMSSSRRRPSPGALVVPDHAGLWPMVRRPLTTGTEVLRQLSVQAVGSSPQLDDDPVEYATVRGARPSSWTSRVVGPPN